MDIVENLTADYQRFPANQTYSLYAQDVFFRDPLNKFRGIKKYKAMIGFINTFFIAPKMDLQAINRVGDTIKMEWVLSWNTPLPWKPRIAIPGWSELKINADGLIASHIDYWNCSRFDVVKQHFLVSKAEHKYLHGYGDNCHFLPKLCKRAIALLPLRQ